MGTNKVNGLGNGGSALGAGKRTSETNSGVFAKEFDAEAKESGIPTGLIELDRMIGGLQKGSLIIVGGRPSMGKTGFGLSIALHAAIQVGRPTAFFSLEMQTEKIFHRMVSMEARVNAHAFLNGTIPREEYPKLTAAAEALYKAPLFVDDTAGITVLEFEAKARRLKMQHNVALIIIDYLQLMASDIKMNRYLHEISEITRALKSIAKEHNVPIVALAQLTRNDRYHPNLRLSHLLKAERDADVFMAIHREGVYCDVGNPENGGKAEIIIGKQENGPVGTVEVAFVKDFGRFENIA